MPSWCAGLARARIHNKIKAYVLSVQGAARVRAGRRDALQIRAARLLIVLASRVRVRACARVFHVKQLMQKFTSRARARDTIQ